MPSPKAPRPSLILKKVKELSQPEDGVKYMINRNPRNLERLRIAYKPVGYHLEKPGRSFWHKYVVLMIYPIPQYYIPKLADLS